MKRFKDSLPIGRMPVFKSDLQLVQNEAADAYLSHLLGLGEPLILSGCEVTVNSPSNLTVAAGVVFLNGDCMRVDAYTGSFPCWLGEGTPVINTKTYSDGSTQDVFTTRVTAMATSDPGGSTIYFDPFTSQYYRHVIKRQSHDVGQLIPYIGTIVKGGYDLFDGSGNGKWEWKNFRIALKGKTMLGFDPSTSTSPASSPSPGVQNYGAIGNTGGADSVALGVSNIPTLTVPISQGDSFTGAGAGGVVGRGSANPNTISATTSGTSASIHENRPAYVVTALLERY